MKIIAGMFALAVLTGCASRPLDSKCLNNVGKPTCSFKPFSELYGPDYAAHLAAANPVTAGQAENGADK